ncbi:DUF6705 family protein [Aquimarina sp. 2201CG14-23]|uniref:DUF6705 family protein n=1 Tax=Aquimarina mycalae TaxID=3040073 RepID=UPI00247804DE|nr:DUF6705 family protein [Aquimarina sp. 2201CG14-23]MDH7446347.1 hypothetical protein [Aquimarina sp. 2201CG14-23]
MKAILKILLVLFAIQGYSQTIIPLEDFENIENRIKTTSDYYYKDVNGVLDKFLGTWRYQTANELFEITFTKKTNHRSGMGYYEDFLISRYKYVKNGVVIYDTYPILQPTGKDPSQFIDGGIIKKPDLNKIILTYDEPSDIGDYGQLLYLEYTPLTQKLNWYLDAILYDDPDNPGELTSGYKIPYLMNLTKVN